VTDRPTAAVSAVLPTYDRAAALRVTLPSALALRGLAELVVVDDGSRDDTPAVLAAYDDPRLRVLRSPVNRGVTAARNTGADAARGEWLLFLEDDCCFPPDYAEVLLATARGLDADVVGAPMVHPRPGEDVPTAVARARAEGGGDGGLDGVARFPPAPVETPLLQAPSLVRRAVWERLRFDEGYTGNAYREETDFFVRTARAGARCVLTPGTFFWEAGRWSGGQPRPLVRAEWWTWRNNWRFLRRHEPWLVERGLVRSALHEQRAFVVRRLRQRLAA
jgi:glycosyltransferase involved in cell wall biosynthesis